MLNFEENTPKTQADDNRLDKQELNKVNCDQKDSSSFKEYNIVVGCYKNTNIDSSFNDKLFTVENIFNQSNDHPEEDVFVFAKKITTFPKNKINTNQKRKTLSVNGYSNFPSTY